jgi:catalase
MSDNNNETRKLTTASGRPYTEHEDSMTAGPRGPVLLQDYVLHEKLAHFNRERIPERIVHAKGSGAYGTFTVTNDITQYTRAKVFNEVGKKTRMFVRFSTVGGEKGSADTARDPRGFATRFYTEDGNYDLVGNNTPVFFIKDAKKFPDFIHTQKRNPYTNCKDATMLWDFWSLNPESMHQIMTLFSDRGTPYSYRHMHGFGSHTFSMINAKDELVWVKFHYITAQGVKNFTNDEAVEMAGKDPDWAQRDLVESIDNGDFPQWHLKIQVMTQQQAKEWEFNPFDLSKTWPHGDFPLIDVGTMELNENPDNYFADVEQSAFAPANIVDGIGFSPDKMLQGRILAYPDAARYRVGTNYQLLPVNRCPFEVNNYQRDGSMRFDGNSGRNPNYYPNSIDNITTDQGAPQHPLELDGMAADFYDRNAPGEDDHFTQPGILFDKVMSEHDQQNTISNFAGSMQGISGPKRDEIINRQLHNFLKTSEKLARGVADKLGVPFPAVKAE